MTHFLTSTDFIIIVCACLLSLIIFCALSVIISFVVIEYKSNYQNDKKRVGFK
jgi:hypothetical protein